MNHAKSLAAVLMIAGILATRACAEPSIALVAGGGTGGDGSKATEARLGSPFGVEIDPKGNLLIIEYAHRLLQVDPAGKITTICGGQTRGDGGDGGPAAKALLNAPHAIAIGADGAVYIADSLNHRVRRIDPSSGVITTIAGSTKGFAGDNGPADKAQFSGIYCISFSPDKSKLVITDLENRRIRVMDMKARTVATVAGNGQRGVPADGAVAAQSPLADPRAAAMDSKGNLYILERGGHALRVVDPAGKIRTLIPGPAKKGDPRTIAGPKHLVIAPNDDVIIADTDNHRVIKWLAREGKLEVLAGTGKSGKGEVGSAPLQCALNQPHGVYLSADGTLYIVDSHNDRVLKIVK